jgi:hypothetical protein
MRMILKVSIGLVLWKLWLQKVKNIFHCKTTDNLLV